MTITPEKKKTIIDKLMKQEITTVEAILDQNTDNLVKYLGLTLGVATAIAKRAEQIKDQATG